MDDNSIVELYLQRDENAISRTMEKYGGRLRALVYGIVKDRGTAEECENDSYREAWNTIPPHPLALFPDPLRCYALGGMSKSTRSCSAVNVREGCAAIGE